MIFKKLFTKRMNKKLEDRLKRFREFYKNDIIIEENMIDKNGESVYLIVRYFNEGELKLGIIDIFNYSNKEERVLFTIDKNTLTIGDIQIFESRNRGIGTKVIKILHKIAIKYGCNKIVGMIHSESEKHREIQIYFYTKNGFNINGTQILKVVN